MVHHFAQDLNSSVAIAIKFVTDTHVPLRMNFNSSVHPMRFLLAPSSSQTLYFCQISLVLTIFFLQSQLNFEFKFTNVCMLTG